MAQPVQENFLENPLFRLYAFYSSILVLKTLLMAFLTVRALRKSKAYANTEDAVSFKAKVKIDENVERVRRAHLNDIENIPIFLFISFIYVLTNPTISLATNLFRVYTIARFTHTFVYAIFVLPQPARSLSFGVGMLITGYMAVQNVLYFLQ